VCARARAHVRAGVQAEDSKQPFPYTHATPFTNSQFYRHLILIVSPLSGPPLNKCWHYAGPMQD